MKFRTARVTGHVTTFIFDDTDPLYSGSGTPVVFARDQHQVEHASATFNLNILPAVFQAGRVDNIRIGGPRTFTVSHLGVEYEDLCAVVAEATGATRTDPTS